MAHEQSTTPPKVTYERYGSEFDVFIDGEYIGSRTGRRAAEELADATVYARLTHQQEAQA